MKKENIGKIVKILIISNLIVSLVGCGKVRDLNDTNETDNTQSQAGDLQIDTEIAENDGSSDATTTDTAGEDVTDKETQENEADTGLASAENTGQILYDTISYTDDVFTTVDEESWTGYYRVEGVTILSDGYSELKDALKDEASSFVRDTHSYVDDANEYVLFLQDENNTAGHPELFYFWKLNSEIEVCRADELYFSYLRKNYKATQTEEYCFDSSATFNSKNGKRVNLSEVIPDGDALLNALVNEFTLHSAPLDSYPDNWKDTLKDGLSDNSQNPVSWALMPNGIKFNFENFKFSEIYYGELTIELTFEEYPELFDAKFAPYKEQSVIPINKYGEYCLEERFDVDGDGKEEILRLDEDFVYNEEFEEEVNEVIISFGRDENNLPYLGHTLEIDSNPAYVFKTKEGKYFLYLEENGYSDYKTIYVYDLNDPDEGPVLVDYFTDGAFYGYIPFDSEHFYLNKRLYCFGTRLGYKEFYIGEDGMPVAYDEEYTLRVIDYDKTFDSSYGFNTEDYSEGMYLTAKEDIKGEYFESLQERQNVTEYIIPKGTKLKPYLSDGKNYMVFELPDGGFVTLKYDDPDDYPKTINGIDESELLDGILYAG